MSQATRPPMFAPAPPSSSEPPPRARPHPDRSASWLRRVLPLLLAQRGRLALGLVTAAAMQVLIVIGPQVLRLAIDESIRAAGPVGLYALLLLGLGVGRALIGFAHRYALHLTAVGIQRDLRTLVQQHLGRQPFAYFDEIQTGQLVSRAHSDIRAVQLFLAFAPVLAISLLGFAIAFVLMATVHLGLAIVAILMLPGVFVVGDRMRRVVYPASWLVQSRLADVATVVEENIAGIRVVKAFAAEASQLRLLERVAERLRWARLEEVDVRARRQPILQNVPRAGLALVFIYGGYLAFDGQITVGALVSFFAYTLILQGPFWFLGWVVVLAQRARAGAGRLFELLDVEPAIQESPDAVDLVAPDGHLRLDGVTFSYGGGPPVLTDLELDVAPGETVAIVGASGSGKSTIARLLPRFYDVDDGAVRVDGQDVRDLTLASLRHHVGVVLGEPYLFSASIRDNIAYARPDAGFDEVRAAARRAGADGFIDELPDGYDTVVGERGYTLSGGQRQRISIARALVANPRVLILDDATSAVDVKVEERIHDALRELARDRTTVVIAQRLSTIALADRVVLLDEGRIVASGQHEELLAEIPAYRELLVHAVVEDDDGDEADVPEESAAVASSADEMVDLDALLDGGPDDPLGADDLRELEDAPGDAKERAQQLLEREPDHPLPALTFSHHEFDRRRFKLTRLLGPHALGIAIGVVLIVIETLALLAGPFLMQQVIDEGVVASDLGMVWMISALYVGTVALNTVVMRWRIRWTGRISQDLMKELRLRVFAHLQRLSMPFFSREKVGRLMTRMTSDLDSLNEFLQDGVVNLAVQGLRLVISAAVLFVMNARLAAVVLLATGPPMLLATVWFRRESQRRYDLVRERIADVLADLQENLAGSRVVTSTNRQPYNVVAHRDVVGEHADAMRASGRAAAVYGPSVQALELAGEAVILVVGAGMVADGSLTIGELTAFIFYLAMFFQPIQQLVNLYNMYQAAQAAVGKLRGLLGTAPSVPEQPTAVVLPEVEGHVLVDRVTFGYDPKVPVLRDINLEVRPGESLALVGETGAGKSTMAKLLTRFVDPDEGSIRLDGHDLRELTFTSLHTSVAFVPQEAFLFGVSLRDNIALGRPDASDAEVDAVARRVGLGPLIERLERGIHTPVQERGSSLSGGERQLLALARAFLMAPKVLVLDEATSNLDLRSESVVERALQRERRSTSLVVIAHRLTTAARADRVAVIDRGRVVELGSHDELVAQDGRYAEMFRTWVRHGGDPGGPGRDDRATATRAS